MYPHTLNGPKFRASIRFNLGKGRRKSWRAIQFNHKLTRFSSRIIGLSPKILTLIYFCYILRKKISWNILTCSEKDSVLRKWNNIALMQRHEYFQENINMQTVRFILLGLHMEVYHVFSNTISISFFFNCSGKMDITKFNTLTIF